MAYTQEEVYAKLDAHYRKNYPYYLKRYSWSLKSHARAEDVIQEAYLQALRYWDKVTEAVVLDAWIITLIKHAIDQNNKEENLHGMTDRPDGIPDETVKPVAIPNILVNQVTERINKKPPAVAEILRRHLLEHETDEEIEAQGLARAGNVRKLVHRFRKEIKAEFNWVI